MDRRPHTKFALVTAAVAVLIGGVCSYVETAIEVFYFQNKHWKAVNVITILLGTVLYALIAGVAMYLIASWSHRRRRIDSISK